MMMIWDENKRETNLAKHGMDFANLDLEFFTSARIISSHTNRFIAIGTFKHDAMITVVFAPLGSEAISIISMRSASKKERTFL